MSVVYLTVYIVASCVHNSFLCTFFFVIAVNTPEDGQQDSFQILLGGAQQHTLRSRARYYSTAHAYRTGSKVVGRTRPGAAITDFSPHSDTAIKLFTVSHMFNIVGTPNGLASYLL